MEPPGQPVRSKTADPAFGRRLREALSRRGVRKLYPLALEIGVDESALSRWRQGQPISLDNAVRLAGRLDVSLDWLLLGRGTPDAHRAPRESGDLLMVQLNRLPPEAIRPLLAFIDAVTPLADQ
jgi:transcriptional regulator with XRE-family HTH domain